MILEIALAASLCTGRITDKNPRAIVSLSKPAVGQTIIDPAFGTKITRISAPLGVGDNAIVKPLYSTMQAWNSDETKLIIWHRGVGYAIHNGQPPYAFDHMAIFDAPTDIEQIFWDPWNPDVLYYPSNRNAEPRLMKYVVSTKTNSLHINLNSICPTGDWSKLLGLGSDPSGPAFMLSGLKVIGMRCGGTLLTVDLASGFAIPKSGGTGANLAVALAPYGQVGQLNGYSLDLIHNLLRNLNLPFPWEHGSVGASLKALNVWNSVQFDSNAASLLSTSLDTGVSKVIIGIANGWPYPPSGTHISSVTRNIGWVAISSVGNPNFNGALNQEIYLGNVDTGEVCRIAHHRSWAGEGKWGYWAEPHLVISPSGNQILFGSDWGNGPSVDAYVVKIQ
jgi:hypothetical protein